MSGRYYINATEVRREFSQTIDNAIYSKPQFIKRTHNHLILIKEEELNSLLSDYRFDVAFIEEDDGTYIAKISIIEDVFATGVTKQEALDSLCTELIEYAEEYYANYDLYTKTSNRKSHAPYVLKILSSPSIEAVKEMLNA